MKIDIISNPFVGCTARDMKYIEVKKYWCDPFKLYRLNEEELYSSKTPIIIEGARGTGKTMILKYLSFFVQKDFVSADNVNAMLLHLKKTGVGIYFRYKADFCNLFENLSCTKEQKNIIFMAYYELFICRELLSVLCSIYQKENSEQVYMMQNILCDLFKLPELDFEGIHKCVNTRIYEIDTLINDSLYVMQWEKVIDKIRDTNHLFNKLVETINQRFPGWSNIRFNLLLDEYENAWEFQKLINTKIKQVDDSINISYRIGMRPGGMENNKTYVAQECLQVDRDFLLRPLTFGTFKEYKLFALQIATKRLEYDELYSKNKLTDLEKILGAKENLDEEAAGIAKDDRQFRLLQNKHSNEKEMKEIVAALTTKEKLMEMYNIIRVERGADYKKIAAICREYCELRQNKKLRGADGELRKYYLDYSSKYRMTLLYVLLTIYKKKKKYYSVNTFLYLSSGAINDFITLCRNTFNYIDNEIFDKLCNGEYVDAKVQTEAAIKTAENQLRKVAMSNRFGKEMRSFIENMGKLFERYHQDYEAKYPETNQFAFVNENAIYQDEELNAYLTELINSGAVIKVEKRQHITIGKPKGHLYRLNRIFAPIFQFSYRTRGGYNHLLSGDDFRKMLQESIDPDKYIGKKSDSAQYEIFDYLGETADD